MTDKTAHWKIPNTEANYQAHIPSWCSHQTVREHMDSLGLCWGITSHMEDGEPMTLDYCKGCEMCTVTE